MIPKVDNRFKVVIFGNAGVGKTTLTNRYLTGVFKEKYQLTIGMDLYVKKLEIDGKIISLQIWDFAGEEQYRFLLPSALMNAEGSIIMYDITRYTTFKSLEDWLSVFNETNKQEGQEIPLILIGSKLDLQEMRAVAKKEASKLAKKYGVLDFIECSSKTGEKINEIFEKITRAMLSNSIVNTTLD